MAKAEGKSFDFLDESHIDPSLLEVFDFDSPEQYIKTETDEFSAVCPFSGLPDIAYVKIEYFPVGNIALMFKNANIFVHNCTTLFKVAVHTFPSYAILSKIA